MDKGSGAQVKYGYFPASSAAFASNFPVVILQVLVYHKLSC